MPVDGRGAEFAGGSAAHAAMGFEGATAIMAVFEGPDLIIRAMNGTARDFVRRDIIGRPLRDGISDMLGQQFVQRATEVFATGEEYQGREWRMQMVGPDGKPFEFYLNFVFRPLIAADGTVWGVFGEGTDVTDLVLSRRAAQAQSAELAGRVEQAQSTLTLLQQALLPASVPVLPEVGLGATYLPAGSDTSAGGDWFDTVALAGGGIALVVGDVVGHGVAASAVMGQLRAVLHERLAAGRAPADAIRDLELFAAGVPGARSATVCVAVLDPGTGAFTYCTAGHPPPLLIGAGGSESRYLAPTGGGPVATGTRHRDGTDVLAPNELLLLYTDGIIERPGRTPARATVELGQVAADAVGGRVTLAEDEAGAVSGVQRACTLTLELLTRISGHTDDITLLAAQRRSPVPDFTLRAATVPGTVGVVRHALASWLAALHTDATTVSAIQHATGELVTNAIEHANLDEPQGRHQVAVTARLTGAGAVEVVVADDGRWRPPRPAEHDRGLGLRMAGELADQLTVDRAETGTTVRLRHSVRQPVPMPSAAASGGPRDGQPRRSSPAAEFIAELTSDEPDAVLVVRGAVDSSTAPLLEHHLRAATYGGTMSRTVDLSGVTLLASAGVHLLHSARDLCAANGEELRLLAPPGSVAHHVLALAALTHD